MDRVFLSEGIVGVDVAIAEHGGGGGLDGGAADSDFGLAGLAHVGIYNRKDQVFVAQGGGAFQAPERRGLAVAIIVDIWS